MNTQLPMTVSLDGDKLSVHSTFHTIQGEGPHSGKRALFIRLAGCNLQCPACDTEYTEGAVEWVPSEFAEHISKELKALSITTTEEHLVVITGGEPFRQERALTNFLQSLFTQTQRTVVQIETNGTHGMKWLLAQLRFEVKGTYIQIVCSPKTQVTSKEILEIADFKFVVDARLPQCKTTGLPLRCLGNKQTINTAEIVAASIANCKELYIQPEDNPDTVVFQKNVKRCVELTMKYGYVLRLQTHKLLGVA